MKLPIPSLKSTIDKYLVTLEPLLTREELEKQMSIAEAFVGGFGTKLQERLEEYGKSKEVCTKPV